jgi:hypothetical protein
MPAAALTQSFSSLTPAGSLAISASAGERLAKAPAIITNQGLS